MGRIAANVGLVGVSLMVAILLAEITLRLLGITHPVFMAYDPVRGFTANRPGAEGWFTEEGRAYVRINSAGLRDREHDLEKSPGTIRIAVLGDSYAAALQVEMENAFWSVMEHDLEQCDALQGRKIEVINFGVASYGTGLEWMTLQKQAWKYDPDIVLLALLTGNDIRNNSYALEQSPVRYYFSLQGGNLVLAPPRSSPTSGVRQLLGVTLHDFLLDQSRIVQLVMYYRAQNQESAQTKRISRDSVEAGLDNEVYREPQDENWRSAWEITEAIIRAINREVRAHGKVLFVATLSNGMQVHPDRSERSAFTKRLEVTDLLYPDRRIIALARTEHIPFGMLVPELLDWAEQNATCVHGFQNATPCGGHWNQQGHRLAGKVLAREICAQVLSKK
ncbi:MAG: SGNH/GDSL hydrolase family protein [Nitrospirales bacterium]